MYKILESLFKKVPDGYINIWSGATKKSSWFAIRDLAQAKQKAYLMSENGEDVYFSLCPFAEVPEKGRGKADGVMCVPFLWCEIDVQDPVAHKGDKYPPDKSAVKQLLLEFGTDPSYIVASGHGYHVYWILEQPVEPEVGADMVKSLQGRIRELARKHGWTIDQTADLARVLRVPNTRNYKDPDNVKDVKVQVNVATEYPLDTFRVSKMRPLRHTKQEPAFLAKPADYDAYRVVKSCGWFRQMRERHQYVDEPRWHTLLTNLALCHNGLGLVEEMHRWCRPESEGYQWKETLEKFSRAEVEAKPHTCQYVMETFAPPSCAECPYDDIGAPITLGGQQYEWLSAMERIKGGECADPLDDLAIIRHQQKDLYKEAKTDLVSQGIVEKKGLDRLVNKRVAKRRAPEFNDEHYKSLDDEYPEYPVKNLYIHEKWMIGDDGVKQHMFDADGIWKKTITASPVPLGIKARFKDTESAEEKIELTWYSEDIWHTVRERRSIVFDRGKIIKLADAGVPVSSERSKDLVRYLTEFEDVNRHVLRPIRMQTRYGWCSRHEFLPFGAPNVELDLDKQLMACYINGTLDEWKDMISPLYQSYQSRTMMSASFAVPLLKILKVRSMIVHLWSGTGKGKTATLKGALSVWGDPDKLMVNFNATRYGLEKRAEQFCDLPLGIDEKQAGTSDLSFMSILVYVISSGVGRTRGNIHGTIDPIRHWRTIALTNGEHPLAEDSTTGGVKTRSIELRFPKMGDDALHNVHSGTLEHFGVAGDAYVQRLLTTSWDDIKAIHDGFVEEFKPKASTKSRSHLDLICAIATGDVLSRQWIWDIGKETAMTEARLLLVWLMDQMEDEEQRDDGIRAYEMFCSWLWGNSLHFQGCTDKSIEQFGEIEGATVTIVPHKFNEIMKAWGFLSPKQIIMSWKEHGLLHTTGNRNTVRASGTYMGKNRPWMYRININNDDDEEVLKDKEATA